MMAEFDFTTTADRLAWSASKWEKYRGRDIIPLWIADMDFATAPAVQAAVAAQVAHGNFGYMAPPHDLAADLVRHYVTHYGWNIQPEWIVWLPGLVLGINLSIKTCCAPGESAITFTPVYPPFRNAAETQQRVTVDVPFELVSDPARPLALDYRIDFDNLEAAVRPDTKILSLCHPHNPIGRLFRRDELDQLAAFCQRHDLFVSSDEVHCDLILDGQTPHVPFARIMAERSPELLARTITLHGPGKVFNLAGLGIAWAIIPDAALRRKYRAEMQRLVPDPSCFGYTALQAALREGEPWRQALLAQLRSNRDRVSQVLDGLHLPHSHPEATFLTWIDARHLQAKVGNAAQWLEQHGVGLSDGADFGAPGFLRLNFALPPALLAQALERISKAIISLA
jgi:cystathionine beta-lyase